LGVFVHWLKLAHASATVSFAGGWSFLEVDGIGELHTLLDELITERTHFSVLLLERGADFE